MKENISFHVNNSRTCSLKKHKLLIFKTLKRNLKAPKNTYKKTTHNIFTHELNS